MVGKEKSGTFRDGILIRPSQVERLASHRTLPVAGGS